MTKLYGLKATVYQWSEPFEKYSFKLFTSAVSAMNHRQEFVSALNESGDYDRVGFKDVKLSEFELED